MQDSFKTIETVPPDLALRNVKALPAQCAVRRAEVEALIAASYETNRLAWRSLPDSRMAEMVIGGGLSSAIYTAARVAAGKDPPWSIDANAKGGGIFETQDRGIFYLNSRNRRDVPAKSRGPGTAAPLNLIPDGVVQASDLSAREYQTNAALAFVARFNLAYLGRPIRSRYVYDVMRGGGVDPGRYTTLIGNKRWNVDRVIVATGIGRDIVPFSLNYMDMDDDDEVRFLTFTEALRYFSVTKFPLADLGKVAVIGAGDSANVIIEYLMGQGPEYGSSVATLDAVEQVDWIGQGLSSCENFRKVARSRYAGIARHLPSNEDPKRYFRVTPIPFKAVSVTREDNRIRVDWSGRFTGPYSRIRQTFGVYDTVISCCGLEPAFPGLPSGAREIIYEAGIPIARKIEGEEIYFVGPCAELPINYREKVANPVLAKIEENAVALFRYADKTAALARRLQ